ncbi:MAG: hypothetical protein M3O71_08975 [Bacteroidota bacterium]|nr:hypothetical protein [Bacteroidota bacterium]
MKKITKLPLLALLIALSVGACKGNKSSGGTDSAKTDSSTTQDTIKHSDTTLKVDTVKPGTDTSDMKTDTVSKKISSKVEIKKTTTKKSKE